MMLLNFYSPDQNSLKSDPVPKPGFEIKSKKGPAMGSRYRTWDRESEVGPSWNRELGFHGSRSGIGNRNNLETKVESLEKLLLMMWNQL